MSKNVASGVAILAFVLTAICYVYKLPGVAVVTFWVGFLVTMWPLLRRDTAAAKPRTFVHVLHLVVAGVAVVAGFAVGAMGIARLIPDAPTWAKLTLVMAWLFVLVFGVFIMGSRRERRSERSDQSRLFGYGLLAAALMAIFLVPVFAYNINVPKWAAELVLAGIAGAVFLLAKYREHRRSQSSIR